MKRTEDSCSYFEQLYQLYQQAKLIRMFVNGKDDVQVKSTVDTNWRPQFVVVSISFSNNLPCLNHQPERIRQHYAIGC